MELLQASFTLEASLTFVDLLPLTFVAFSAMIWALKIAAWFLWQTNQEKATEGGVQTAMASRFWLAAHIVWLFDPLFSLVYFSRLKYILASYGIHWGRSRCRSRNQKGRAYDLVKTAFRFRLRLHPLRSAYDLVKTRLSESEAEAEAEELNQSQSVGTCIMISLSFHFCFRLTQSGFHYSMSGT